MDFRRIMNYCGNLQLNNNRTWFRENHEEYDLAKKDFLGFLDMLRFVINDEAPDIGKSIMYMEPKEWMYRVARDMRFHKNGPPYNPAFRAYISPDRKSRMPIGYYLRVCPGSSCFGTGLWCDTTAKMNNIRSYISENFDEFQKILEKTYVTVSGDKLKTMPKGFSRDNPAAEYIKMKNWEIIYFIPDEDIDTFEDFCQELMFYIRRIEPMRQFLLKAAKHVENKRPEFEW
ncbi:MAG: DUF2461 domain-containing protein [Acutalibacteraceae bacterium]